MVLPSSFLAPLVSRRALRPRSPSLSARCAVSPAFSHPAALSHCGSGASRRFNTHPACPFFFSPLPQPALLHFSPQPPPPRLPADPSAALCKAHWRRSQSSPCPVWRRASGTSRESFATSHPSPPTPGLVLPAAPHCVSNAVSQCDPAVPHTCGAHVVHTSQARMPTACVLRRPLGPVGPLSSLIHTPTPFGGRGFASLPPPLPFSPPPPSLAHAPTPRLSCQLKVVPWPDQPIDVGGPPDAGRARQLSLPQERVARGLVTLHPVRAAAQAGNAARPRPGASTSRLRVPPFLATAVPQD